MVEQIEIPESNKWADFVWPEWVPAELREDIEKSHRGPSEWNTPSVYKPRPDFGERLTLSDWSNREQKHTGRWVHAWGNVGRLVLDDGTYVCVSPPPKHGCRPAPLLVSTEKSRKLAHVETIQSTTYRLRPADKASRSGDWCHATIDDVYWILSIASDFGDWSYRWSVERNRTLTQAIACDFNTEYMAGKLCKDSREYDPVATENECRKRLLEARREGSLTRDEAREAWDELDYIGWDDDRDAYESLSRISVFRCDTHEYLQHGPTAAFIHLRDAYLPALIDALRALPAPTPDPLPGTVPRG